MNAFEVLSAAVPELAPMRGFDQRSPYHSYDVLEHTSRVCRAVEEFTGGNASPELRWAAFLHDIAKPATFTQDETGRGHFFGHPKVGAKMAEMIMRRLAFPKQFVARTCTLIRYHDHRMYPNSRSVRRTLVKLERACPGDARALIYQLIDIKRCDAVAKVPKAAHYAVELDVITEAVRAEILKKPPLRTSELAIGGWDVIDSLCIPPGPVVGRIMEELLFSVINGEVENTREALLKQMRKGW
jgi:tRNA nucleotidyltransferase (CCA-adding enzyme)